MKNNFCEHVCHFSQLLQDDLRELICVHIHCEKVEVEEEGCSFKEPATADTAQADTVQANTVKTQNEMVSETID